MCCLCSAGAGKADSSEEGGPGLDLEKGEGQLLLLGAAGGGAVGDKKASSASAGMQPSPAAPDSARQSSVELPGSDRNSTEGSGIGSPRDVQRSSPAGDSAPLVL